MLKNKFFKPAILLLALALILPLAACRKPGHVDNLVDLPVVASSGSVTKEKVKGAIFGACIRRGWVAREISPGLISASITTKRGVSAEVEIPYTGTKFSINYKNSVGLSYNPQNQTINSRYVCWVNNLRQDIVAALIRL